MFDDVEHGADAWGVVKALLEIVTSTAFLSLIAVALVTAAYYYRIVANGHQKIAELIRKQIKLENDEKKYLLDLVQRDNSILNMPKVRKVYHRSDGILPPPSSTQRKSDNQLAVAANGVARFLTGAPDSVAVLTVHIGSGPVNWPSRTIGRSKNVCKANLTSVRHLIGSQWRAARDLDTMA